MSRQNQSFSRLLAMGILAISAFLLVESCKTEEMPGKWINKEMIIDGKMTEWDSMPGVYFEESRTLMEFCNDSEHLYIMVRFGDPIWIRTIKMGGLTLWLDAEGKKSKKVGIRYSGGPSREEMQKMGFGGRFADRMGPDMPLPAEEEPTGPPERLLFINEENPEGIPIPTDGSEGPAVAYSVIDGFCIYELRIPISANIYDVPGLNLRAGQKYSIGAEWGDIGELMEKMRERGSGPPMGGGERGRGRPGGMGERRPSLPEKQEVWVKTDFAAPEVVETPENEVF